MIFKFYIFTRFCPQSGNTGQYWTTTQLIASYLRSTPDIYPLISVMKINYTNQHAK